MASFIQHLVSSPEDGRSKRYSRLHRSSSDSARRPLRDCETKARLDVRVGFHENQSRNRWASDGHLALALHIFGMVVSSKKVKMRAANLIL